MSPLGPLTPDQITKCESTISSNAFYLIVGSALANRAPLSVVRMADGERALYKNSLEGDESDLIEQPHGETKNWLEWFGCDGITKGEFRKRLVRAAKESTYFAPSVSGILMPNYSMYDIITYKRKYVDNFFPNAWDWLMKVRLYQYAQHVCFVHRSRSLADALQIRCKYALGVQVTYVELSNWQYSEYAIEQVLKCDAKLVIFSGGPANKYIAPAIAQQSAKVVLDIGQAAERWALPDLMDLPQVKGRYVKVEKY